MKRGRFIVIDGGEGAGKGTALRMLKVALPPDKVVFTREPGGSPFAEEIRNLILLSEKGNDADALTRFALFWAARADHGRATILPAISSGHHVISDRYDSSTWAYQICGQENASLKELFWSMREACSTVKPNLYIYMDVDPEEGLRRAKSRGEINHFETLSIDFHTRVRSGFLEFFSIINAQGTRTQIIDANRPLEEVVTQVSEVVCSFVK